MNATTDRDTLTRSVEDYLKAIYRLSPEGRPASTSEIAHLLELSAPSVSGMVKRLSELGLLEHIPYKGVQLTDAGRRRGTPHGAAPPADRGLPGRVPGLRLGHRAREAERLEHAVSDTLVERMAAALGHPVVDPHGDPIPDADGSIHELACTPLAEVAVGETVEIRRVDESEPERLRYLATLGLSPGVTVTVRRPPAVRRSGHDRVRGRAATSSAPSSRRWCSVRREEPPMSAASTSPVEELGGWRYPRTLPSLPESHHTSRCLAVCRSGARRSPSPARATWSPSATWTPATGPPTSPAARASAIRC